MKKFLGISHRQREEGAPPAKRWRGDRRRGTQSPRGREKRRGTWWDGDKQLHEGIDFAQDSDGDQMDEVLFIPDSDSDEGNIEEVLFDSEFVTETELQDFGEANVVDVPAINTGVVDALPINTDMVDAEKKAREDYIFAPSDWAVRNGVADVVRNMLTILMSPSSSSVKQKKS